MIANVIKHISEEYTHVKFDLSLTETIDFIKQNKLENEILVFTVKQKTVRVTDVYDNDTTDFGPHGYSIAHLTLPLVLEKYPDIDTKFLFWKQDNLHPLVYNYPIFSVSNMPYDGVYNPQLFHDYLCAIPRMIEMSNAQSTFRDKRKTAYARSGVTGIFLDIINGIDWFDTYKFRFCLFSSIFNDVCDIKLFEPSYDSYLGPKLTSEQKSLINKLPLFDKMTSIEQMWESQLNVQINVLSEGNASMSHGRCLMSLYNNGHIIRIGPTKYMGIIDTMIKSCDYNLINHVCPNADSTFYRSITSLIDHEIDFEERRKVVLSNFSHDAVIDMIYQMIGLYNQNVKH